MLLLLGPVGIELGVEFGGIEEIDLVERDASQHLAYLVAAGPAQLTECCATGASVNRPFPLHRAWRKASSAGIFRQRRISQSLFSQPRSSVLGFGDGDEVAVDTPGFMLVVPDLLAVFLEELICFFLGIHVPRMNG